MLNKFVITMVEPGARSTEELDVSPGRYLIGLRVGTITDTESFSADEVRKLREVLGVAAEKELIGLSIHVYANSPIEAIAVLKRQFNESLSRPQRARNRQPKLRAAS